ncbi:MAG: hypothetical protein KTR31_21405 [Myxococcales bacterium]|nr:hypothetical protein [Myxococcales bacterium]
MWWMMMVGCFTLPSEEGAFDGDIEPNLKMKVRERRHVLPGMSSTPPPPEEAVTSGQCGDLTDGGPVAGPDCVTATISCGETVIGHTRGGVDQFDTAFWEKKFCWPATVPHDSGDERVYRLEMPDGEWRAYVWLDTPCADLDMMAALHTGDTCPTLGHNVRRCESGLQKGSGQREMMELVHQGKATWYIVVEGSGDDEGAFALHVQCREGLQ